MYISSKKNNKNKGNVFIGTAEKTCNIRYFVISDLFISSFHCIDKQKLLGDNYLRLELFSLSETESLKVNW